jgi:hypothetical protein
MASYSNPSPDTHVEVLYRQTYNSRSDITAGGLTQNNTVGNDQKKNNARWVAATPPLGILAGSVVAVAGDFSVGPCAGDSSATFDKAVGIAVNNAVGNPYESSSAVASGKAVYAHGTGTVVHTDIYETKETDGTANISYTAGDKLYASQNGLLTNLSGLDNTNLTYSTLIGICLKAPVPGSDPYMAVQLRI